jgi:hypothetical protein
MLTSSSSSSLVNGEQLTSSSRTPVNVGIFEIFFSPFKTQKVRQGKQIIQIIISK